MNPNKTAPRRFGLTETPLDERDFQLGAITRLPALDTLPEEFVIPYIVKDQGNSDFCSAYMSCAMSEPQEETTLEPSWSFAKSKELSGDVDAWGQNLRDALRAHTKFGAIDADFSPFNLQNKSADFLRDIRNWSNMESNALPHRKKSFFKVSGQYDSFDNARASLWHFGSPIGTGVNWGWSLSQKRLDSIPQNGYGHAVTIVGYTGDDLIMLNSYGEDTGDGGVHYISRAVYNTFADRYGAYMFIDISPEDAEYNMSRGIFLEDNWLVALWKAFISLFK